MREPAGGGAQGAVRIRGSGSIPAWTRCVCSSHAGHAQGLCRAKSVVSDRTLGAISCSQVKEILVEESNVQPVNAPVTVRMASQGMLSTASMQLLALTGSPGCAPHAHACRSAVTSMASSMTCCACLRLAGRCPPPTTSSWVTLWTGATTGGACCTKKQAWVQP